MAVGALQSMAVAVAAPDGRKDKDELVDVFVGAIVGAPTMPPSALAAKLAVVAAGTGLSREFRLDEAVLVALQILTVRSCGHAWFE